MQSTVRAKKKSGASPGFPAPEFSRHAPLDSATEIESAPRIVVASELARLSQEFESQGPQIRPIPPTFERTDISVWSAVRIKMLRFINALIELLAPKRKISRKSARALGQLRKLAHVYAASSAFSPEEQILFDTAFGQAYYEILSYARSHQEDDPAHDLKFKSVMRSFVSSLG